METPADFGTGLRAHLGLEETLAPVAETEAAPVEGPLEFEPIVLEPVALVPAPPTVSDDVRRLEQERVLAEREWELAEREALLARRSAAVLAQVQALYDELHGDLPALEDELAVIRARRAARPA